jgi:hypothetical protein
MAYPRMNIDRALCNVEYDTAGGCWLWAGSMFWTGYGSVSVRGRRRLAHRYFYEQFKGAIPEHAVLLHSCDVRACVNPAHLRPGTPAQNAADASRKGRLAQPRGSAANRSKLSEAQVDEIRAALKAGGETQYDLAARYGVSQKTISNISRGRCYGGPTLSGSISEIARLARDERLSAKEALDRIRGVLHAFAAREGVTLNQTEAA